MAYVLFGSYSMDAFSSGVGSILRSKDVSAPVVTPITSNIARGYGAVKNGELVGPRDIPLTIKIVATDRNDLNARLDALKKALRLRGQALTIFEDGRYFSNTDCLSAVATLAGAANIASCIVQCSFRSYDTMAYAASSSLYDTGVVALTLASGVYNFPAISIVGGGTIESYPLIRITNKTSGTNQWSAISVSQVQDSQTLTTYSTAGVPLPAINGDYVDIQCDPIAGMSIITNGSGEKSDPVGVFPVIEPDTTIFNIAITSPSAVSAEAIFSWSARYL